MLLLKALCVCACVYECVNEKDHSPLAPVFPFIISVTNTTQCEDTCMRERRNTHPPPISPNEEGILCLEIAKYIFRYLENKTERRERHSSSF